MSKHYRFLNLLRNVSALPLSINKSEYIAIIGKNVKYNTQKTYVRKVRFCKVQSCLQ